MHAALRPYVTAGVVLVGSSVIAVAPIAPSQPEVRTVNWDVSLAAATSNTTDCAAGDTSTSCNAATQREMFADTLEGLGVTTAADAPNLFNIAANLFIAMSNVPYNFLNALGAGDVPLGSEPNSGFSFQPSDNGVDLNQTGVVGLTAALNYGGSWWVYSPTNVLGSDLGDIPRYQALVNLAIPFPALSVPLGNMLAAIATSQLPMNVGCTGTGAGACPNILAILSTMFDLRHIGAMLSPAGYTFPEVRDPITCDADGKCDILDQAGPTTPWSGQTVKLDLSAPFTSVFNSLNATPDFSQIRVPSFQMVVDTLVNFAKGLNIDFNPFVLGTQCGLCAPLVPNPGNLPVPGPTNPGTTTSDVSTLAAEFGLEQQGEEQPGEEQNSNGPGLQNTSLQRTFVTSLQKKTVVTEPDQGLVNTEVDPTKPVDNTEVDPTKPVDNTEVDPTKPVDNTEGAGETATGAGTVGSSPATSPTTPSTDTTMTPKDGNKFVPGGGQQSGGKHGTPDGGLNGFQQSVHDTIEKVTGAFKGGGTTAGADTTPKAGDTNQGGEANKGGEAGSGKQSE